MEVGIKLWSKNSVSCIDEADFADFIEVLPTSTSSISKFQRRKRKYVIHVPHEIFGFSPLVNMEKSRKLLDLAVTAARKLKARLLIMHGGFAKGNPDEETIAEGLSKVAKLAKTVSYGRLLIENSIPKGTFHIDQGKHYICYSYEQLRRVIEESGIGFCLDFEHAKITAHQLGLDFRDHIAELMRLRPEYFQLSGVKLAANMHHTTIFNSDIDLKFVKRILKKANKPVCLETPLDVEQRRKEVAFLKQTTA
ncbi:TIM barrel protein [Candidatus Woesearchaeota archaeon]|nr:TIM barrel protein [Candidatus Woesearchaeota archaeon]